MAAGRAPHQVAHLGEAHVQVGHFLQPPAPRSRPCTALVSDWAGTGPGAELAALHPPLAPPLPLQALPWAFSGRFHDIASIEAPARRRLPAPVLRGCCLGFAAAGAALARGIQDSSGTAGCSVPWILSSPAWACWCRGCANPSMHARRPPAERGPAGTEGRRRRRSGQLQLGSTTLVPHSGIRQCQSKLIHGSIKLHVAGWRRARLLRRQLAARRLACWASCM